MPGQGLPLDIDLDLVANFVDESLPWLQAWAGLILATFLVVVATSIRNWLRVRRSPVARLMRR